jgi:nickel-dependent lactate racemase
VGVDFILYVVKNSCGQVVEAVAGELEMAHEHGVSLCKKSWQLDLPHPYDIVIVSPGDYFRDIDLHQSQKAMSAAKMVIEKDGVIVLIAECPDGIGKYADWLKQAGSRNEVIERFKCEGFTKDHSSKAYMCDRALESYKVYFYCSGNDPIKLEQMFSERFNHRRMLSTKLWSKRSLMHVCLCHRRRSVVFPGYLN